jgi:hypothetical protein
MLGSVDVADLPSNLETIIKLKKAQEHRSYLAALE